MLLNLVYILQSPTQDHAAKEKALQTMSSMSSAQIVSATAIHNKAAAAGLASLGLTSPVSYPTAVSAPLSHAYRRNHQNVSLVRQGCHSNSQTASGIYLY